MLLFHHQIAVSMCCSMISSCLLKMVFTFIILLFIKWVIKKPKFLNVLNLLCIFFGKVFFRWDFSQYHWQFFCLFIFKYTKVSTNHLAQFLPKLSKQDEIHKALFIKIFNSNLFVKVFPFFFLLIVLFSSFVASNP